MKLSLWIASALMAAALLQAAPERAAAADAWGCNFDKCIAYCTKVGGKLCNTYCSKRMSEKQAAGTCKSADAKEPGRTALARRTPNA